MVFQKFKGFKLASRAVFKDPDTGYEYSANSQVDLYNHIQKYREQNGLEKIDMLPSVVENYQCGLPENAGMCIGEDVLTRGFLPSLRGGVTLLVSALYKKMVSKKAANERSKICLKCPHNVFPLHKAVYVERADQLAEKLTGGRKSSNYSELGNCGVCSCPLRAKVWLDSDNFKLSLKQIEKTPKDCWQRPENGIKRNG